MKTVTERLELAEDADLLRLYDALLAAMTASYDGLTMILGQGSGGKEAHSEELGLAAAHNHSH